MWQLKRKFDTFPVWCLQDVDPRLMQINITGFLNAKGAREFMAELWEMVIQAQESADGIPQKLVDMKKIEIKKKMVKIML